MNINNAYDLNIVQYNRTFHILDNDEYDNFVNASSVETIINGCEDKAKVVGFSDKDHIFFKDNSLSNLAIIALPKTEAERNEWVEELKGKYVKFDVGGATLDDSFLVEELAKIYSIALYDQIKD